MSLQQTETAVRDLLALLPPDAACPDLPEAVRRALALCREAEEAGTRHQQAAAEATAGAGLLERCRKALEDSRCRTREAARKLETARTGWAAGLRSLGLPEDLAPGTVHAALDGMDACLRLEAELQQEDSRLQRLHHDVEALRAPLAALLTELGRPVPPQDADWLRHLDMLAEAAEEARHHAAEQARLRRLLAEQETACQRAENDLDGIRADLAALLRQGEARDDGAFLQTADLLEERHQAEQRRLLLEDSLRLVAGDQPLETFLAAFREEAREEEEQGRDEQQRLLAELRQEEDALAEDVAALGVRVEAMQQDGTLADLLQQEAGQREELQRQARAWCRLRLAHALLHRAKLAFEKERQPRVIRRAAAIFRDITAGAWQDVGAVVGDSGLRVMPPQGEPVSPEQLSRGTQEQLYLAPAPGLYPGSRGTGRPPARHHGRCAGGLRSRPGTAHGPHPGDFSQGNTVSGSSCSSSPAIPIRRPCCARCSPAPPSSSWTRAGSARRAGGDARRALTSLNARPRTAGTGEDSARRRVHRQEGTSPARGPCLSPPCNASCGS